MRGKYKLQQQIIADYLSFPTQQKDYQVKNLVVLLHSKTEAHFPSGVKLQKECRLPFCRYMGIDLSGGDRAMPQ